MEWLFDEGYVQFIMEEHNLWKAKHPQKTDEEIAQMLKPHLPPYWVWQMTSNIKKDLGF